MGISSRVTITLAGKPYGAGAPNFKTLRRVLGPLVMSDAGSERGLDAIVDMICATIQVCDPSFTRAVFDNLNVTFVEISAAMLAIGPMCAFDWIVSEPPFPPRAVLCDAFIAAARGQVPGDSTAPITLH